MKERIPIVFRWFLPVMFAIYYSCITFFVHTHIENGVPIVHSHPFKKTTGEASDHHSSSSEIYLFQELSSIHSTGNVIPAIELNYYKQSLAEICEPIIEVDIITFIAGTFLLRAPPCYS